MTWRKTENRRVSIIRETDVIAIRQVINNVSIWPVVYELFGVPVVSAFVHSRFALFFACKIEKGFTRRVHFSLLQMIMVMQFGASFGNVHIFYFLDVRG
jgi:hypothetical protein